MVLNPQNCGSREDTLPCCLQNIVLWVRLPPLQAQRCCIPFFLYTLVQELADTPNDIVSFVGHLCVEVDVGHA